MPQFVVHVTSFKEGEVLYNWNESSIYKLGVINWYWKELKRWLDKDEQQSPVILQKSVAAECICQTF